MGRPIPIQDRIEYLEAAIECAKLMRDALQVRGFDTQRDWDRLDSHMNGMLETLSALYLERSFHPVDCETPEPA